MRPTGNPTSTSRGHTLATTAIATVVRYGPGLFAPAATALFAALVLTACGSSTQTAEDRSVDGTATVERPRDRQITSEPVTLSTSGPLVPTMPGTGEPANLGGHPRRPGVEHRRRPISARLDQRADRRSNGAAASISTRFDVLRFFLSGRNIDDDDVFATLGQPPAADAPDEVHLQFFVQIHNHADEIHVKPADDEPPRTLGYWFRTLHPLAQSIYEQQERYRR